MTEILKPCPFCGGLAHIAVFYNEVYAAECSDCACRSNFFTKHLAAIDAWNKRAKLNQLKPCPFCGKLPKLIHFEEDRQLTYFVRCNNCMCTSVSSYEFQDVLNSWNNRAS